MPLHIRIAAALALTTVLATGQQAGARGLTPWDVARLTSVGEVAVSPDGARVAYTLSVPRAPMIDDDGPNWVELHVYDRESDTSRPFVTGEVDVSKITWTPDGSHIAFLSKRRGDEKTVLWVIPADGGEARRLVRHDESISEYAFSSDGQKVVFLAKPSKTEREQQLEEQGFDMEGYEEQVPNNQMFWVDVDLNDMRADGEVAATQVIVEGHPADLMARPGHDQVMVTIAPDARIDERYMFRRWTLIDLASGVVAGSIDTEGKLGGAAFSPDGEHFAFVGAVDLNDPAAGRLEVAPATGGEPTEILPDFMGHVTDVAWRDANTVLYLADVGVQTQLGQVTADGRNAKVLVEDEVPVLASLGVSTDGKIVAARGESPTHPAELFVGRTGKSLQRATKHNGWLDDLTLGEQVVHTWNARDGLELQGILVKPIGYEEGQRYPLIACVHGGPESHDSNGWKTWYSRPGQYMAAQGYFVWYPNYRGSTGRGVEFSLLSQGDPGGAEFDDIVDGVDDLIERGWVDGEKVGITGGSYGGYATAWGATRYSDRYAAAVMFVGISEQYSKFGTTDIPRESQLVHQYPRKVYDDWQFFLERSPIYHAKGSKTPLLILGGKDDTRVHPSQSLIMYRYFEFMADAPVRLVRYPGEKHGNRKAAAKLDYSLRLTRWMNHFVRDGGTEKPPFEVDYEEMGEVVGR